MTESEAIELGWRATVRSAVDMLLGRPRIGKTWREVLRQAAPAPEPIPDGIVELELQPDGSYAPRQVRRVDVEV